MQGFLLFLTVLSVSISNVYAQIQIEETKHDFGNIYTNSTTYYDFTFKNIGQSKTYLLTVDKPREVSYVFSSKLIEADESMTLRLKVNDQIKGRFNYHIDVHFGNSNKPVTLCLMGNIKEKSGNPLTACPDFNAAPPKGGLAHFALVVKVIDSITKEPLRRSKVYLINNGVMVGAHYTNYNGIVKAEVPLGLYYITAQKPPYKSNYHEGYLNYQNNYVEIALNKGGREIEEEIVNNEEEIVIIEEVEEEEEIEIIETENSPNPIIEVEEIIDIETPILDSSDFNNSLFLPNNIVFIVDVSGSMNQMGKMDLLKFAMIELTEILREQDQVTLIAYSGSVRTLLEFESGENKNQIITQVKSLDAGGYTAGGEAIKQGVKLAKKGYIDGGNNLVFLVTDGAFNKGSQDYIRAVESTYKKNGIKFSVVGIKTLDYLTNQMTTVATKGGGSYIRILSVEDAQEKLINEVKRTSFKAN